MQFSQRFKNIIDRYNAGGSENEDYYEQLVKLLEDLKKEQERPNTEGLTEEELEVYDLLVRGKKLTKAEEQKVKLAAKNLYKKLTTERDELLVVDWYKDDQPRLKVKSAIEYALNEDLPESYDKEVFEAKINLLLNHFIDMAIQGYGWIAA
jgi:type I restriction enzyme R subunit